MHIRPVTKTPRIVLFLYSFVALSVPLILISWLPLLSNWQLNRYQVSVQDLGFPLLLNTLAACIVALLFLRLLLIDRLAGYLGAILTTLLFTNGFDKRMDALYPLVQALDPFHQLGEWQDTLYSIAVAGILLAIATIISIAISRIFQHKGIKFLDSTGGLTVAIVIISILQIAPVLHTLTIEWPQFFYRPPSLVANTITSSKGTPDIFYIVLDRYASQSVLDTQLHFDNSSFTQFLARSGIITNPNAHNNYPYTTMSIASTLNADYQTDIINKFSGASQQTLEPYHEAIRYSSVIQRFKQLGYSYTSIGSEYEATNQAPLADSDTEQDGKLTLFNYTFTLNGYGKNELNRSIFARIIKQGIHIHNIVAVSYKSQDNARAAMSQLSTLKQLAKQPPAKRLIFAHILIPHDPYVFNADGSLSTTPNSDNVGKPIQQKYLEQVSFINNQMEDVINTIDATSNKQAVIILQADEGPYPMQLTGNVFDPIQVNAEVSQGNMLNWSDSALAMKFGNLAAYRVPQADAADSEKAEDSVNIFRLVLNTYFNQKLPYLPQCIYAYADGREKPFNYTDITQRLTHQDSTCPVDSIFIKQ